MNRNIVALTALVLTVPGVLVGLFLSSQHLPPRVASHFNAAGVPDGWMLRNSYLWFMAGLALGLSVFFVGVFYSIRYFPQSTINLPYRDYWLRLSVARRHSTLFLRRRLAGNLSSSVFVRASPARRGRECLRPGQARPAHMAAFRRVRAGDDRLGLFSYSAIPPDRLTRRCSCPAN